MSAAAMAWAFRSIREGKVPGGPSQALVLLRLADRADPEGRCWPGHQRTAADLRISESTARLAIKSLEKAGLLEITRRKMAGRDDSNLYVLALSSFPVDNCAEKKEGVGAEIRHPDADLREFRVPKSGTESKRREPHKREGHAPRAQRGGTPRNSLCGRELELEIDKMTNIHHQPGNARDKAAMARIREFGIQEVVWAVDKARRQDPESRAFPSLVLRLLLKPQHQAPPAWATAGGRLRGGVEDDVIEGSAKWTD